MTKWDDVFAEVISAPGVAMVVGATDTGKTSFCVRLCNASTGAGIPTAVVDADVGQSEIGAPGTIGMGFADKPIESLSDIKPKRLYFVGNTTPVGHLLESAVGTKKLVDAAQEQGAKLIIVDTTGLVDGPIGRRLKTYKTDLLRPDYLIGIQKHREIDHLLIPFTKITPVKIKRISSSEGVRRKPPEFRAARRQLNFYKHFHDAPGHMIRMEDVCFWNTWLGTGRPIKWQYIKSAENALRCRILHAEITGKGIFIVSERPCSVSGRRAVEEQFNIGSITFATGDMFTNLLVGLGDENGNILNVGLIQAVDFKQRFLFVLSPMRTASPVRVVQFGTIRVTKEGKELGTIRQGDI